MEINKKLKHRQRLIEDILNIKPNKSITYNIKTTFKIVIYYLFLSQETPRAKGYLSKNSKIQSMVN